MKMKRFFKYSLVGIFCMMMAACGGGGNGGSGGGSGTINLTPVAKGAPSTKAEASLPSKGLLAKAFNFVFGEPVNAQSPETVTFDISGGSVTLTSALVVFSEVDFEEVNELEDDDFDVEGPFLVEMVGSTCIPDKITDISVPEGTFEEIRFRFDDLNDPPEELPVNLPSGCLSPPGIFGKSILFVGTVTPTGAPLPQPFTFRTDLDERIEFPFTFSGVTIDSDDVVDFLVAFDLEGIFNSVPGGATAIADAASSFGGLLDEDAPGAPDPVKLVADAIEDAIDDNIDIFNDLNENDEPDAGEDIGDEDSMSGTTGSED